MIDLNKPSWRWFFGLPVNEKKESLNPFEWIDKAVRECLINGTQVNHKLNKDTKWIRYKPTFCQTPSRRKAIFEYKIIGKEVIVRSREI